MILLVLGVLLWAGAHFFKRIAPARRAAMGEPGKGAVSLALVAAVLLMIFGYRMAEGAFFWGRSPALTGLNNLLMLGSVYLFSAAGMKTRAARMLRHPQLTGFALWCAAHLLVNGDTPSFVLWGGLLIWALLEMAVINRAEPVWTPPAPAPARKEIMAVVGAVVVFAAIAAVHIWLGYNPFG
ncbi:NnrU family protein [Pseudooceanicola sp.]|uniref:NnrU family protein n=1 Tax=Pseudooceanicola sp. TaxID=1914328 RepID=UPI003518DE66